MNLLSLFFYLSVVVLSSCTSHPPQNVNNICSIFNQYPRWYENSLDVERRWKVPVSVQMAIIHQESKFDSNAQPQPNKLLWIIPWKRPSTAYGYAQALRSTWALYKHSHNGGSMWASRSAFSDAVDFIGWYANQANQRAGISRSDAYHLYLAYHEGVGGYQQKSFLKKPWLIQVSRKVAVRAQIFQAQLKQCHRV